MPELEFRPKPWNQPNCHWQPVMMSAFQKPPQKGRTSIHREKIKSTSNPMEPTVSYRQAINLLLGDQISNLEKHTDRGIDYVDRFGSFVKERQKIEIEYASQLKKLHKNYLPKKKEEEDYKRYTALHAFRQILSEVNSIANQHELIGEYLVTNVLKEVQALISELRSERKKHLQEFKQDDNNLEKSIRKMEGTKSTYKHSHEAWMTSKMNFEKANEDMNQTKAQVEKYRATMNGKNSQKCECKDNYILQLDNTNKEQRDFYYTKIPQIFNKIQEMDERRNQRLGEFYTSYAEGHRQVIPLIQNCLDTMTSEAEKVDPSKDSRQTIDRYKTGLVPPDDIQMIDFDELQRKESNVDTVSMHSLQSLKDVDKNGTLSSIAMRKRRAKGTIFGMFGKKEDKDGSRASTSIKMKIPHTPSFRRKEEPKEDFSHLPPNQQSKKLKEKLDDLNNLIESEVKSKEGLQRMREVYTKNPTLGDPASVDRQLAEIGKKMDVLRMDLNKYQKFMGHSPYKNNSLPSGCELTPTDTDNDNEQNEDTSEPKGHRQSVLAEIKNYLAHAEGRPITTTPQGTPQSTPQGTPQQPSKTHDHGRESETERLPPSGAETPQTITEHDGQNSSGEPLSSPGWGGQNSFDDQDREEPIGKCRAIYEFTTDDENLLCLGKGEEVELIEKDSGDGWTRVRRGEDEGYVPTTYIEYM
ncbi:cdc42-interacting protein 4 isoform X8 [Strongylocentrotus purpuratus]|uniref:Formin-binding protein 1-like n=1 Tax=Strongylocentrotus purpuratus TaxID=7668 RepID=A0A7M7PP58_STRPU|nr:cdc42-interacting protein 4 isoform X8 [Strongylocentrotus purpuratus]